MPVVRNRDIVYGTPCMLERTKNRPSMAEIIVDNEMGRFDYFKKMYHRGLQKRHLVIKILSKHATYITLICVPLSFDEWQGINQ